MTAAKRVNWRKVADRLAERLANHAYCDNHPASKSALDCPFCQDRDAYYAYVIAGGTDHLYPSSAGASTWNRPPATRQRRQEADRRRRQT